MQRACCNHYGRNEQTIMQNGIASAIYSCYILLPLRPAACPASAASATALAVDKSAADTAGLVDSDLDDLPDLLSDSDSDTDAPGASTNVGGRSPRTRRQAASTRHLPSTPLRPEIPKQKRRATSLAAAPPPPVRRRVPGLWSSPTVGPAGPLPASPARLPRSASRYSGLGASSRRTPAPCCSCGPARARPRPPSSQR